VAPPFSQTCEEWSRVFPIPYEKDNSDEKKGESKFQYSCAKNAEPKDLHDWGWSGRSADERVPDPAAKPDMIILNRGEGSLRNTCQAGQCILAVPL
jgi:hypothetical protein